MRPLERLGLEVAAFQLLGSRTQAATLCALLSSETASWESLASVRPWLNQDEPGVARNVVKTRICLLREKLEDVGIENAINTINGFGYGVSKKNRDAILSRLIDVASHQRTDHRPRGA